VTGSARGRDLAVGVDLGSTHVKAVVADLDGRVLGIGRAPTPARSDGDGGAVHPPDALVGTAERVVREALEASDAGDERGATAGRVGAIGIASVAEAGAPVDSSGRPIADVIAWYDPRSAPEARRIADEVGSEALFARTGVRAEAKVTLAKLLWLRDHEPDMLERMAGWRFVADLVGGAWTDGAGTSVTLACRSAAWNLRAARWDHELLAIAGLSPERMPEVVAWDASIGALTADAAVRLGLAAGLPIAVAGHDHLVGGLAVGVAAPGDALDSIGTAEAVVLVTDEPVLDDAVRRAGFSVGAHVLPDRFTLIGGLATSGGFVDWFLDALAGVPADAAPSSRYERLADLVGAARRRPTGIVARPTLRGRAAPDPDPAATAAFEGLAMGDGLPELALAVLEGSAFHVRWMLDELAVLAGRPIERIRTIGGGSENPDLLAVKRVLSPASFEVPDVSEAVAAGAALVGAVAGGLAPATIVTDRRPPLRPTPAGTGDDSDLARAYEAVYRDRFRARGSVSPSSGARRPPR
jgi:xylulokinase